MIRRNKGKDAMIKIIAGIILVFVLAFSSSPGFTEEPTNYCLDKESWEEWEALVKKYPNDEEVQTLHALRLGLCVKVEQGSITFEQATDIFNRAHQIVIQNTKSEQERKGPKL
jgi:hypothetical protein